MERKRRTNLLRGLGTATVVVIAMAMCPAFASAIGTVHGNDENSGVPLSSTKLDFVDNAPEMNRQGGEEGQGQVLATATASDDTGASGTSTARISLR